jgi:anaerobic selenocysteine-containing dehydrogenase
MDGELPEVTSGGGNHPPQPLRTACPYCGVGCGIILDADGMRTYQPGMTLRDWLAGQALAGWVDQGHSHRDAAKHAYDMADAMLAEREKGGAK